VTGAAGPAATEWRAIGTVVRLVVTDPDQLDAGRRLLAGQLAVLDLTCSRFREDSELVRAERKAGTAVEVSGMLADAIAVALHAAEVTDGDLDPTVGTHLVRLGYDRDFRLVAPEGAAIPVAGAPRPRWREIRLDRRARMLTVPRGVRLDLGATAKARTADLAATRLADRLGCGVLVSLGGDIAIGGEPPDDGWQVRIQDVTGHPDEPPAGPAEVISVSGGGVSSSGTAARRWRRGGVTMHHILDPRTGLPAPPVWRTVSAVAETAVLANIATTAAVIRGTGAPAWLAARGVAARLVAADGRVRRTPGWPGTESAARETAAPETAPPGKPSRGRPAPGTLPPGKAAPQAAPPGKKPPGKRQAAREPTGRKPAAREPTGRKPAAREPTATMPRRAGAAAAPGTAPSGDVA
jgi:thiamine biosynthesis lipoprotein